MQDYNVKLIFREILLRIKKLYISHFQSKVRKCFFIEKRLRTIIIPSFFDRIGLYQLEYLLYYYFNIYRKREDFYRPVDKNLLSVIIVTCNSGHCLDEALWIFDETDIGKSVEIIIIDNNSKDNAYLKKHEGKRNYHIIYNQENLFFTKTVNQGMKIAKGGYVLLLNPDVSWEKTMAGQPIVEMINALEVDQKNGIAGILQLNKDNMEITVYGMVSINVLTRKRIPPGRVYMRLIGLIKSEWENIGEKVSEKHMKNKEVSLEMGSVMMFKRELVNDIGFLPCYTKKAKHYHSDTQYSYIAAARGWKIISVGKSYAYHVTGQSSK